MIKEQGKKAFEASTKSGEASKIINAWLQQFEDGGWEVSKKVSEKIIGDLKD